MIEAPSTCAMLLAGKREEDCEPLVPEADRKPLLVLPFDLPADAERVGDFSTFIVPLCV